MCLCLHVYMCVVCKRVRVCRKCAQFVSENVSSNHCFQKLWCAGQHGHVESLADAAHVSNDNGSV